MKTSDMKSLEGSLVKSVCCSMFSSVKIEPREPERRVEMQSDGGNIGLLVRLGGFLAV